jgi:hypothetical protein
MYAPNDRADKLHADQWQRKMGVIIGGKRPSFDMERNRIFSHQIFIVNNTLIGTGLLLHTMTGSPIMQPDFVISIEFKISLQLLHYTTASSLSKWIIK